MESIQWSGGQDGLPVESVSLAFQKVTVTYGVQNNDGTLAGETPASWDLVHQTP